MKNCLKIHFLQDLSKSRFSLKKALKKKGDTFNGCFGTSIENIYELIN